MAYKVIVESIKLSTNETEDSFKIVQKTSNDNLDNTNGILLNVIHKQQMYKTGYLEVKLNTTKSSSDFRGKLISLLDEDGNVYANRYYINSIRKCDEYVTLIAYSADYFLTIDKFCQAFTAKTLVGDIITNTIQNNNTSNFEKFRTIVADKADKSTVTYVQNNVRNFCNKQTGEETTYTESIIPYAVQYNESFYDFMVRMCNRDGEFLYLDDDNSLCIGLKSQESTTKKINDTFTNPTIEYIDYSDEVDCSTWEERNYLGLSFSSKGETDEEEVRNQDGYIYNFNKNTTDSLPKSCYVLAPEFLEDVSSKEKYAKWGDYTCAFSEIIAKFHAFGDERSVFDALASLAVSAVHEESVYAKFLLESNNDFKDRFKDNRVLYSTNMELRTNKGYETIFKYQESSKKNQLIVSTKFRPEIKLGDIIEDYVVCEFNKSVIADGSTANNNLDDIQYNEKYELHLVKKVDKTDTKIESIHSDYFPLPNPEIRVKKASAQRAIVVDNYDPSRLGRVRVKYPWQDGEVNVEGKGDMNAINSTPWIRISTPMASDGAGFLFIPAVNDEVLVDYEDGDIERPYVCGAFYNNTNRPSIASQSQTHGKVKSITSAHGHHISFTDTGDAARFITSVSPIFNTIGSFGVYGNGFNTEDSKHFSGGFEISDYYGIYAIKGSTHNRSIDINSPLGKISIDALTGITINAPLGDVKIVGKNVSIEARNNLTIESGTNIKSNFFQGNSKFKSIDDNIISDLLYSTVSSEILDLGFIRNVLEILLRPIGGSMLIKSNRYMKLEAGDGDTTVEHNANLGFFKTFLGKPMPTKNSIEYNRIYQEVVNAKELCDWIWDETMNLVNTVKFNNSTVQGSFKKIFNDRGDVVSRNQLGQLIQQLGIDDRYQLEVLRGSFETIKEINDKKVRGKATEIIDYKEKLWNTVVQWSKNPNVHIDVIEKFDANKLMYKKMKEYVKANLDSLEVKNINDFSSLDTISDSFVARENKRQKSIGNFFKKLTTYDNLKPLWEDRIWTTLDKGAILLSDKEGKCFKLGEDGNMQGVYAGSDRDEILMYFKRLQKYNSR